MSVSIYERKDRRGGGYSKRKFTFKEAQMVRLEYETGTFTQVQLAIKYSVSLETARFVDIGLKILTYFKKNLIFTFKKKFLETDKAVETARFVDMLETAGYTDIG